MATRGYSDSIRQNTASDEDTKKVENYTIEEVMVNPDRLKAHE